MESNADHHIRKKAIGRRLPRATFDNMTPVDGNSVAGEALKKKILLNLRDLPPMPQTVLKAREIMAKPNSSFKELAAILEVDQAIGMKVLKLANSAYYGLRGKVSSIQHASVVLGQKALGEIITVAGTAGLLGNKLAGYDLEAGDLWRHSLAVAFASKTIANQYCPKLTHDAFAAGLIHDTGKLILDRHLQERKEALVEIMADNECSFLDAEKRILGFDHAEIASELCNTWNVPQSLTKAIRYHHYPQKSDNDQLTTILHVADVASMMMGLGLGMDGMMYEMDEKAINSLKLTLSDINTIIGQVLESVEGVSQQMNA